VKYTSLGPSTLEVSRIALGCMGLGEPTRGVNPWALGEGAAGPIFRGAVELGITLWDTANVYGYGASEEVVGRAIKRYTRREDIVLATKLGLPMHDAPGGSGLSRKAITEQIDGSLTRLGTDYIDLYQLHGDDPETPIDETLRALDDVVRAGKVRYIGCSNFLAYRVALALGRSETLGLARFDSVQPRYNLLFREFERELFPLCLEEGIGVIPYNPLAGGMLSGKHVRGQPPAEGTRFTISNAGAMYQERYWHQREFDAVDAFQQIAKRAGLKPATLAVAWVLAQPAVTAPILGASRPDQLDDTLAAVAVKLDDDLLHEVDKLTREFRRGDAAR
jgi:aryl-alcohol dehydrogenase (NADP+)